MNYLVKEEPSVLFPELRTNEIVLCNLFCYLGGKYEKDISVKRTLPSPMWGTACINRERLLAIRVAGHMPPHLLWFLEQIYKTE